MGTYMLKQPDGLIAIFSSVVDDFTHWDATPGEALAYGVEQWGRSEAWPYRMLGRPHRVPR